MEESAQIRLEGFDDQIENVPNIDENVAERILEERRRDKVNKFRLFAFRRRGRPRRGRGVLSRAIFATRTSAPPFWNACLFKRPLCRPVLYLPCRPGLLLLVTLLRDTAYLPSFLASNTAYFIAVLVLYGVVLAANIPNLIQGFSFKNGVRYDFSPLSWRPFLLPPIRYCCI